MSPVPSVDWSSPDNLDLGIAALGHYAHDAVPNVLFVVIGHYANRYTWSIHANFSNAARKAPRVRWPVTSPTTAPARQMHATMIIMRIRSSATGVVHRAITTTNETIDATQSTFFRSHDPAISGRKRRCTTLTHSKR